MRPHAALLFSAHCKTGHQALQRITPAGSGGADISEGGADVSPLLTEPTPLPVFGRNRCLLSEDGVVTWPGRSSIGFGGTMDDVPASPKLPRSATRATIAARDVTPSLAKTRRT